MFRRDAFHVHSSFRVTELSAGRDNASLHSHTHSASLFDEAQAIANAIERVLLRHCCGEGGGQRANCIGIVAPKSAYLVSMVIGVLKTDNAFAIFEPGPHRSLEHRFARFRIKFALFDASLSLDDSDFCYTKFPFVSERLKIGNFVKVPPNGTSTADATDYAQILYAIQTSGSTGIPKVVLVPFSAILPNIEDFIERFSLCAASAVLYATHTNFDPSLVELLVAMRVGCELVIPPSDWLCCGAIAGTLLRDFRLSFVQLTPALLQCLPADTLRHIFGRHSRIHSLLIGGDNFPLNLVTNFMKTDCPMAVFNVYGLTEVSCWASVHRFRLSDAIKFPLNLVPIGRPLMGTRLEIASNGILLVHGRRCVINFEQYPNEGGGPTPTGDMAFTADAGGGELCIFVRGRHKPNSMLPTGAECEHELLAAFPHQISFAKLLYVANCRFLFADHLDGVSALSERKLRAKMAKHLWPTRTFWNVHKKGRLTENGKIDERFLRQFVLSEYRGQISVQQFLENRFSIYADSQTLRESLRHLGIGSLEAAEIAFLLHNKNNANQSQHSEDDNAAHALRFLLDERNTLGDFLCQFSTKTMAMMVGDNDNSNNNDDGDADADANNECAVGDGGGEGGHDQQKQQQLQASTATQFRIEQLWAENLGKCIDGTPIYHGGVVYATSHSGTVAGVQLSTGVTVTSLHCPDDRFEAGCSVAGGTNLLALGGFAGIMRLFDLTTSPEHGCSHAIASVNCGAEIRMAPVFNAAGTRLFWGTYDGRIWRLDIGIGPNLPGGHKSGVGGGVVIHQFDASGHGFLRSSPLLINTNTPPLLVFGTLGSAVFAVWCEFDSVVWSLQMDSPVFATPIAFADGCLSLSVRGQLRLVRPEDGQIVGALSLSNYGGNNHFFDSPTPIGRHVDAVVDGDHQQQQHLLLISAAGANGVNSSSSSPSALLLLSYTAAATSSTTTPSNCYTNANASSFAVLRRFLLPWQNATVAESVVRRPVLFGRFAFLLTTKGTLFRLSLDALHHQMLLLPHHHHCRRRRSSSSDRRNNNSNNGLPRVVQPPLLLDRVFSMDQQQQVETFGHPLLLHHQHELSSLMSTTTTEDVEQNEDDGDDPPFVVVFGARDDLLRAQLCVPQRRMTNGGRTEKSDTTP